MFGAGFSDGPDSFEEGDSGSFSWPSLELHTGITANRSEIGMHQITDGTSQTFLLGEKYLDVNNYFTGKDWGDNHNLFSGDDMEIVRFGGELARDTPGQMLFFAFGSAHPSGCFMAMCDGSVRQTSYDMDLRVHDRLANRRDGEVVNPDGL